MCAWDNGLRVHLFPIAAKRQMVFGGWVTEAHEREKEAGLYGDGMARARR